MILSYLFCHSLIHSNCIHDVYRLCRNNIASFIRGSKEVHFMQTIFGKRSEISCRCSYRHRRHSIRNLFSFSCFTFAWYFCCCCCCMKCIWSLVEARLLARIVWYSMNISFSNSNQSQNLNTNLYYAKNCLQFKETSR